MILSRSVSLISRQRNCGAIDIEVLPSYYIAATGMLTYCNAGRHGVAPSLCESMLLATVLRLAAGPAPQTATTLGIFLGSSVYPSWFIAQMAAWVRLLTRILRRIALTWTLTVASAISFLRAIVLLESPSIR